MREILEQYNQGVLTDVGNLLRDLELAPTPRELEPYRLKLLQIGEERQARARRNLRYLGLGRDEILNDILSETRLLREDVRLLSSRLAIPVLRAGDSDRLCLKIIGWLHREHARTADYPPVFTDGAPAILPFVEFVPIYYFPCVEQRGLLYQPLLFHELGHLLYRLHLDEMDDLVRELQRRVADVLSPPSQRNDSYSRQQAGRRQTIVTTWYRWAQELYCDAVGLMIGGPSFLYAFSTYLSALATGDYYREPDALRYSTHPVTWLRIRFLIGRAVELGLEEQARRVEGAWLDTAQTLGAREDYHGYYDPSLAAPISSMIDDMLTEVSPRPYTDADAAAGGWDPDSDSPVRLLNWAWQVHNAEPDVYSAWEAGQVARYLQGDDG